MNYTLTDMERAINYWRNRFPSADGVSICRQVSILAGPYTQMFIARQDIIADSDLDAEQVEALATALTALG